MCFGRTTQLKKIGALHSSNSVNKCKYNGLLTSLVIDFVICYEAFSKEVLFIVPGSYATVK